MRDRYLGLDDVPKHLETDLTTWFASFRLDAINKEGTQAIVRVWRRSTDDRVIETTLEMELEETITFVVNPTPEEHKFNE